MKQSIMFDLDDTLVHCNKYFYTVLDQFADYMFSWFDSASANRETIRSKQVELDIAGVHLVGFQSERFPQSLLETYHYFSQLLGRRNHRNEEQTLWELGMSVYDIPVEPYPQMEETLQQLALAGHDLHLYTGGDPAIQYRKIDRMGLQRFFGDQIYVRQLKNVSALAVILDEGHFDRSRTWMIGNSARTDIVPALQNGLNAIYLKQEAEWSYNVVPIETMPTGAFYTLSGLHDIPRVIDEYARQASVS